MSHSVGPSYIVAAHDFTKYMKFILGRLLKINLGHTLSHFAASINLERRKKWEIIISLLHSLKQHFK